MKLSGIESLRYRQQEKGSQRFATALDMVVLWLSFKENMFLFGCSAPNASYESSTLYFRKARRGASSDTNLVAWRCIYTKFATLAGST